MRAAPRGHDGDEHPMLPRAPRCIRRPKRFIRRRKGAGGGDVNVKSKKFWKEAFMAEAGWRVVAQRLVRRLGGSRLIWWSGVGRTFVACGGGRDHSTWSRVCRVKQDGSCWR